jgi:hypothetical protein
MDVAELHGRALQQLQQLQPQTAYHRLLERLGLADEGWPDDTLATLSRRALILFLNAVSSVRSWIAVLLASMAPDRPRPGFADRAACSPPG